MWLEDILEVGEAGRYLRGYKLRKYGFLGSLLVSTAAVHTWHRC